MRRIEEDDAVLSLRIVHLGDSALLVSLGKDAGEATLARVRSAVGALRSAPPAGTLEVVSGFTTVAVHFDPLLVTYRSFAAEVSALLEDAAAAPAPETRLVEIPVCYGGDLGPDLDGVGAHAGLETEQVIAIHSGRDYLVHMIGFAPGFPYLGGMSERIATPRRDTPRQAVPAGSVGIAGAQTGVYPIETPGGWQLIGRTPLHLFRPTQDEPSLLRPGDTVRFVVIDRDVFDTHSGEVV